MQRPTQPRQHVKRNHERENAPTTRNSLPDALFCRRHVTPSLKPTAAGAWNFASGTISMVNRDAAPEPASDGGMGLPSAFMATKYLSSERSTSTDCRDTVRSSSCFTTWNVLFGPPLPSPSTVEPWMRTNLVLSATDCSATFNPEPPARCTTNVAAQPHKRCPVRPSFSPVPTMLTATYLRGHPFHHKHQWNHPASAASIGQSPVNNAKIVAECPHTFIRPLSPCGAAGCSCLAGKQA
jgi:hypothetical protein